MFSDKRYKWLYKGLKKTSSFPWICGSKKGGFILLIENNGHELQIQLYALNILSRNMLDTAQYLVRHFFKNSSSLMKVSYKKEARH